MWSNGFDFASNLSNLASYQNRLNAVSICQPILIRDGEETVPFVAQRLARKSVMGKTFMPLTEGRPVKCLFRQHHIISGWVAFAGRDQARINFDFEVDVKMLLAVLARRRLREVPRKPMALDLRCAGELLFEGRSIAIETRSLSQGGFECAAKGLKVGDEVIAILDGLASRWAAVRSIADGRARLQFLYPLHFEEFAQCAAHCHES